MIVLTKKDGGFTLVELMLYISIVSVLLLVISIFLSAILQARVKNQTIAEVEQQGLFVMQTITQTVRNAVDITAPVPQGSTGTSLVVTVLDPAKNPTTFELKSGTIQVTENLAEPVALTSSRITVSALSFQNLSPNATPGTIRIQFTLNSVNSSGRQEYSYGKTFNSTAVLRQP